MVERQRQHWDDANKNTGLDEDDKWQTEMIKDKDSLGNRVIPTLYVIACNLFNKSLTLDIENRLIGYTVSVAGCKHSSKKEYKVENGRYNPQNRYFSQKYSDDVFRTVWNELHRFDEDFFIDEVDRFFRFSIRLVREVK